jgi:hypothetical protein
VTETMPALPVPGEAFAEVEGVGEIPNELADMTTTASAVRRINVRNGLASAGRWRIRQQAAVVGDLCDSFRRKRKQGAGRSSTDATAYVSAINARTHSRFANIASLHMHA